ncbi:FCD domain-containing protein [Rhodobacterales bacterium HKCCE3408]|nr:FCD domain-containing protein [Rhodobacterales bacterium HKCCE3408]
MTRRTGVADPAPFDVPPLDYARPANEQISAALKSAILAMQLSPGQMISENEVGQMFGASRTPVREAFAQLREEGLIVTWPSRGTFVSRLSVRQIRGAQFLREAVEVSVVERLAATGLPPDAEAELADNLARQRQAVSRSDKTGFQRLDDRFHAILADATGLDRIGPVLVREKAVLDRLRVLSLNDAAYMESLLGEHEAIAGALRARYTSGAVDHTRRHLRRVLDTLSDLVAANRDYFDQPEA